MSRRVKQLGRARLSPLVLEHLNRHWCYEGTRVVSQDDVVFTATTRMTSVLWSLGIAPSALHINFLNIMVGNLFIMEYQFVW